VRMASKTRASVLGIVFRSSLKSDRSGGDDQVTGNVQS